MPDVAWVAGIAIVVTAITAVVVPFLTARANRAADARKTLETRRISLYVDLNRVAIRDGRTLARAADSITQSRSDDESVPIDALTAQVKLLASFGVQEAWTELTDAREGAFFIWGENYSPEEEIPTTDEEWVRLSKAVERLLAVTRADADSQ